MDKLRKIDLNDYDLFGGGATSKTYYPKGETETMLKVFIDSVDPNMAKKEFEQTQKVAKLGISTPQALEMVDVDGRIGIIFQRVKNKISVAAYCGSHDKEVEKIARDFAHEAKILHNTPCDPSLFVSKKEHVYNLVSNAKTLSKEQKDRVLKALKEVPDVTTCLHNDMHMGNLLITDGGYRWIDIGDFSYGHPYFDIACLYFATRFLGHTDKNHELYHMTTDQLYRFYDAFVDEYFAHDKDQIEAFKKELHKYLVFFYIFVVEVNNFFVGGEELYYKTINNL